MYEEALSSEYLVITGGWIEDMLLTQKTWVFPGQRCTRIDLSPVNYAFDVQATSAEKLPFILPAVFTIRPRTYDHDSLLKYAKLILSFRDTTSTHVIKLIEGVVEGETRALAASMTMEDIFKGTKKFKQEVFDKVQVELNRFGLRVYNANIKQPVVGVQGHEYSSYVGEKVGPKLTRQNAAKFDAETKNLSTQRGKEQELKLKSMNALTATEKLKEQEANSALYGKQKVAEAAYLGQKQKEAEAVKPAAEAEYQRKKKVEGELSWRDTSTLRRRKPRGSSL